MQNTEHGNDNFFIKKNGFKELWALGHIVSGLWIAVDQNKVAAVLHRPIPQDVKDVQSFLGFANYYRSHLDAFARTSGPLYKLVQKGVAFEMMKDRVESWMKLKEQMTTAPFLLHPNFSLPSKLYVDASFEGLGAALQQIQTINDKPYEGPICFLL